MEKKKPEGSHANHLQPEKDCLQTFLLADDTIRGAVLNGSWMINQMRWNHELGILESLVLGHAYLGACLMGAGLKGKDRLCLQVDCSGPVKGLVVEANAAGEVRGFLKNVPIPVEKPLEDFNLSPFFGAGVYLGDPHPGRYQTTLYRQGDDDPRQFGQGSGPLLSHL